MRFLHHDESLLERTFELIIYAAKGSSERSKIEQTLDLLVSKFYKLDFPKIQHNARRLKVITDQEIQLLSNPTLYQQSKAQGYSFQRYVGHPVQQREPVQPRQETNTDQLRLIPDQQCELVPSYKQGYSLMYGSPHFYVQLKLIATIYERLQKAQTLL